MHSVWGRVPGCLSEPAATTSRATIAANLRGAKAEAARKRTGMRIRLQRQHGHAADAAVEQGLDTQHAGSWLRLQDLR